MVSNAYFFPASRGSFSGIIAHFMIDSDSRQFCSMRFFLSNNSRKIGG